MFYWRYLLFAQSVRYALAVEQLAAADVKTLLTDMDRNSGCSPIVIAAKTLGITTATLVHGCPSEQYLPILSDHVLVWSTLQGDWFRGAGYSGGIHVIGRPDVCFMAETSTRGRIVVAHSMEVLTEYEVCRLQSVLMHAGELGKTRSLRLHPVAQSITSQDRWAELIVDAVEYADGTLDWLSDCGLLVTVSSTVAIDALSYGVPCLVVADPIRELPCELQYLRDICDESKYGQYLTRPARESVLAARAKVLPLVGVEAGKRVSEVIDQISHMRPSMGGSCN